MTFPFFIQHIWAVPVFPLLGAAFARVVARFCLCRGESATRPLGRAGRAAPYVSVASVAVPFVWLLAALLQLVGRPAGQRVCETVLFEWIPGVGRSGFQATATASLRFGFLLDPLGATVALMVTAIAVLIHIYAMGDGDIARVRRANFFSCFDLCVASMLTIVLANDLFVLFAGWAALTVFVYLLSLFSESDASSLKGASHAVLLNCCGDITLLLGAIWISCALGSTRFVDILNFANGQNGAPRTSVFIAAAILIVVAASVKAAQFPWHFWLADAVKCMPSAGALIQTVTMLPAGVFLLIRVSPLLRLSSAALWIAGLIGAASIITATCAAMVENDLKKILAYSAVAQIGFVFLACGFGAFSGSVFHLLTLAVFQCALVLGAGVLIYPTDGESDIRQMAEQPKRMPFAYWTMLIGAFGIAWVFPFAGFSAQDFTISGPSLPRVVLSIFGCALGLAMAFSMTRVFVLAFHGSTNASLDSGTTSGIWSLPGISIAIFAAIDVVIGLAAWKMAGQFGRFATEATMTRGVTPFVSMANSRYEIHSMLASGLFVLLGIGGALYLYLWRPYLPGKIAQRWSRMHALMASSYRTGEFFTSIVPPEIEKLSVAVRNFDSEIIDGVSVSAFTRVTQSVSTALRRFDGEALDQSVDVGVQVFRLASFPARLLQTGLVQSYLLLIVGGIVSFLGYVLIFHHGH